jgi:hypothetical protein
MLLGCAKPVPDGAYRVTVKESTDAPKSMTRVYVMESASLRKIVLAELGGSNAVSIAPDSITKERTGTAQASIAVELHGTGEDTQVTIKMTVESKSSTARAEETLALPGASDLASVLTEVTPTGDLTTPTTLLHLGSGKKFLQIVIE